MSNDLIEVAGTPATTNTLELADVEGTKEYMDNYQALCKSILEPSDYQKIRVNGKLRAFKKKSAWRKIALAFNISDTVLEKEIIRDENHQIISATFLVKATAPNGRTGEATASCSIFDKINNKDKEQPSNFELRKRFSNAENDVLTTAHTRAKSRAISDLVGMGEVSAEEMEGIAEENKKHAVVATPKKTTSAKSKKVSPTKKAKTAPPKDDEAIEVEIVGDGNSKSIKELMDENKDIKKAVNELQEENRIINRGSVRDRLLTMVESGTLKEEDYNKAKELLE